MTIHFLHKGKCTIVALTLCSGNMGCHTARGTLRTRAAFEFNCEESMVNVENISGMTYSAEGCGQQAIYTCAASHDNALENKTVCVRELTSEDAAKGRESNSKAEKPSKPSVDSNIAAPNGAAGFEFSMSADEAEAVCTKAGFSWTKIDKKHAECSGTPVSVSFAAVPRLRFCGGKLCVVQLDVEREKTVGLGKVFAELYSAIQSKYGPKMDGNMAISQSCTSGDFRACIVNEEVRINLSWRLGSGESIALFTGESRIGPESSPGLYLYYATSRPQGQPQGL